MNSNQLLAYAIINGIIALGFVINDDDRKLRWTNFNAWISIVLFFIWAITLK